MNCVAPMLTALGLTLLMGCTDSPDSNTSTDAPRIDVRKVLDSPQYKKALADVIALQEKEDKVQEEAPWIGKTGLREEVERELPRYVRREFGQSIFDPGSLKAANLQYVGRFNEKGEEVHYWKIAYGQEKAYAYVIVRGRGTTTGLGGRSPPTT